MTMKLWGRKTSINVQKVLWLAAEINLDLDRIDAGGKFGGLDSDAFGAMNPNRRVPVLQDGTLTLWESNAILRYLAASRESGDIWPEDLKQRAIADQWMEWNTSSFWNSLRVVFIGQIRTPPEKRNEQMILEEANMCCGMAKILDRQLEGRDYILGDRLSLGDIPIGATFYRYSTLDIDRPATPNAAKWYERLQRHAGFSEHVMLPLE